MSDKMPAKEYLRLNPTASYDEFFKATGSHRQNYYNLRHRLRLSIPYNKDKKQPEILHVTGTKEPSQQSILYKKMCAMENEMRGLRTVISYLEHQLGLKQSATQL